MLGDESAPVILHQGYAALLVPPAPLLLRAPPDLPGYHTHEAWTAGAHPTCHVQHHLETLSVAIHITLSKAKPVVAGRLDPVWQNAVPVRKAQPLGPADLVFDCRVCSRPEQDLHNLWAAAGVWGGVWVPVGCMVQWGAPLQVPQVDRRLLPQQQVHRPHVPLHGGLVERSQPKLRARQQ
jgi:hypothetical protein